MPLDISTNGVRKKLEELGAVNPSRRAVAVIATVVSTQGATSYWEITVPDYVIKQAVKACDGLLGEDSNRMFAKSCLNRTSA